MEADVVVVGAGGAGLPAAIAARDLGATVICLDANSDVGGHAVLSGGHLCLGGGTSLQQRHGIEDSADLVYHDHVTAAGLDVGRMGRGFRYDDRELVRAWADECRETFEFLVENGVDVSGLIPETLPGIFPGTTPRSVFVRPFSDDLNETINGSGGSGVVRPLERSARSKGVVFLLEHRLTRVVRGEEGSVTAVVAEHRGEQVEIAARRGVVLATGGHTSNVGFRRMFDPRLTEEYQTAGEPWSEQSAAGELCAMEIGAALWGTAAQSHSWRSVMKTIHIGCRWGYPSLKWRPESPVFPAARASGLTVADFQDLILVDQQGHRVWNEVDASGAFFEACLAAGGEDGVNGGGPIWAIFDAGAVRREGWDPRPPNVDPLGWSSRPAPSRSSRGRSPTRTSDDR
jgi:hypothetical protein